MVNARKVNPLDSHEKMVTGPCAQGCREGKLAANGRTPNFGLWRWRDAGDFEISLQAHRRKVPAVSATELSRRMCLVSTFRTANRLTPPGINQCRLTLC